jgi:hypothetical protein
MGIFGPEAPSTYVNQLGAKSIQPCKPEYEKMIANVQAQKKASKDLYDALLHYIDTNGYGNDASSHVFIGGLIIEMRDQDKIIAKLIAQQEAEK